MPGGGPDRHVDGRRDDDLLVGYGQLVNTAVVVGHVHHHLFGHHQDLVVQNCMCAKGHLTRCFRHPWQAHIRLGLPAWLIFLSVWAVSPLHEVLDALPVALVEDLERLIIRFIGLCMLLLLLIVV
jgi:hypothetical protein